MLALVKKPHIEISIHGDHIDELLAWIKKKYEVTVLVEEDQDDFLPVESTSFWKKMEKNRIGKVITNGVAGPIPTPWPGVSARRLRSTKNT